MNKYVNFLLRKLRYINICISNNYDVFYYNIIIIIIILYFKHNDAAERPCLFSETSYLYLFTSYISFKMFLLEGTPCIMYTYMHEPLMFYHKYHCDKTFFLSYNTIFHRTVYVFKGYLPQHRRMKSLLTGALNL